MISSFVFVNNTNRTTDDVPASLGRDCVQYPNSIRIKNVINAKMLLYGHKLQPKPKKNRKWRWAQYNKFVREWAKELG